MSIEIKQNVCLKNYTTWRVGGAAREFVEVKSTAELKEALSLNKHATILGGGSNVLISDNGINGLVIKNQMRKVLLDGDLVIAQSGAPFTLVANYFYLSSFGGLEWAQGIPGTIGGAVIGNAGAHGSSMANVIEWVEVLRGGDIVRLSNNQCGFSYRKSSFKKDDIILSCALKTIKSDQKVIASMRSNFLAYRKQTQPAGNSCGSVFKGVKQSCHKNINSAGFFIEQAGLKNYQIGGAVVSDKHANFILNPHGTATAVDILELVNYIKLTVYKMFGIVLQEEFKFLE